MDIKVFLLSLTLQRQFFLSVVERIGRNQKTKHKRKKTLYSIRDLRFLITLALYIQGNEKVSFFQVFIKYLTSAPLLSNITAKRIKCISFKKSVLFFSFKLFPPENVFTLKVVFVYKISCVNKEYIQKRKTNLRSCYLDLGDSLL